MKTPKRIDDDNRDFSFRGIANKDGPLGYIKKCNECGASCGPQYQIEEGDGGLWNIKYNWECECGNLMDGNVDVILRSKKPHSKVIITGPGRSGTTFLIRLLSRLDVNTGFPSDYEKLAPGTRGAGCEHIIVDMPIYSQVTPYVLKSPEWCFLLRSFLEKKILAVDHVLIPIRDLETAAKSRIDVDLLWKMEEPDLIHQTAIHRAALGTLMETIALHDIPFTFMKFPLLTKDLNYCYDCLYKAFELDWNSFRKVFPKLANPKMIKFK